MLRKAMSNQQKTTFTQGEKRCRDVHVVVVVMVTGMGMGMGAVGPLPKDANWWSSWPRPTVVPCAGASFLAAA